MSLQRAILSAKTIKLSSKYVELQNGDILQKLLADPANISLLARHAGLSEALGCVLMKEAEFIRDYSMAATQGKFTLDLERVRAVAIQDVGRYETDVDVNSRQSFEPFPDAPHHESAFDLRAHTFNVAAPFIPDGADFENVIDDLGNLSGNHFTRNDNKQEFKRIGSTEKNSFSILFVSFSVAMVTMICFATYSFLK
jgi:hypothetical protein